MELRQLKYFLAVADSRSFVRAASTLYVSRQAISKAIGQLEAELDTELFVRDSSGAFLTPAGLMFYDRVRPSVLELERIHSEMLRYGLRYHQRVRLLFSVGIMQLFEAALQEFRIEQENLALDYQECPHDLCLDALREHKADLLICTSRPKTAEFSVHTLTQSPYGVLLQDAPSLRATESLDLEDLSWIPMAALRDGATETLKEQAGLQIQYQGYDLYRLFSLVRSGRCAMLLPKLMVPEYLSGLIWLPLNNIAPWSVYGVCLQSLENNVLYHTTIEELQARVFEQVPVLK